MKKACDYDAIAEGVFAPLFPVVASAALRRTGVTSGRMLDLGCGGGHLGYAVMRAAPFEGWFLDISAEAVRLCRERARRLGLEGRSHWSVGDVHTLPFEDTFFDLVVSRGSVGFWSDYLRAFGELRRVLGRGGKAYVGGGLGDRETQKTIRARMLELDPNWPANIKKNQRKCSSEEFCRVFDQVGLEHEVVENEDEGRWFVLSRPR